MKKPERSKYQFVSINESFKRVVNTEQKYNESLLDYLKCLKQYKYILGAHVGRDIMGQYV